jgi:hypothetical protein
MVHPIGPIFNDQVVLGLLDPLVGKPAGNRRVSKPRHRLEYNIKNDPKEIERDDASFFGLSHLGVSGGLL